MTPTEVIAGIMERIVDRPGHNTLAWEVIKKLNAAGFAIVPKEPTNAQIIAALEFALAWMSQNGVDGLSPFKDYPPPGETAKGMYRAMLDAVA